MEGTCKHLVVPIAFRDLLRDFHVLPIHLLFPQEYAHVLSSTYILSRSSLVPIQKRLSYPWPNDLDLYLYSSSSGCSSVTTYMSSHPNHTSSKRRIPDRPNHTLINPLLNHFLHLLSPKPIIPPHPKLLFHPPLTSQPHRHILDFSV